LFLIKHSYFMEYVKLLFYGTEKSKTNEHTIECYANGSNEIYLNIDMDGSEYYQAHICLNKATAIRLQRELKKQISYIEYQEDGE